VDQRFATPILHRAISRRGFAFGGVALTAMATIAARVAFAEPASDRAAGRVVKIALLDFIGGSHDVADIAHDVTRIVTDDLGTSGHFVMIDPAGAGEGNIDNLPQFGAWRSLGADALVTGRVSPLADRLRSEFRLWDVAAGWQLMGVQYVAEVPHARQVGHAIAGAIYERLIGEARDFDPDPH
jgi:TolB protein